MAFNSLIFLVSLCFLLLLYYVCTPKYRYILLLIASFLFYSCWGIQITVFLIATILLTYLLAYFIQGFASKQRYKKGILFLCVGILVGILIYFKDGTYLINMVYSWFASDKRFTGSIIMPIGLSFYIFKTISYVIDVYRDPKALEKNIFKFALYVSYFPQIVSGPIERSARFFKELNREKAFDYSSVKAGIIRIFWGIFKKIVIADNLAVFVATVYMDYETIPGLTLFLNTIFYSIQIYCDFSGYSDISIGISQALGMNLTENFKQPYFATSLSDFWNRWHISLSQWLKDYIYIPLGGNRKGKVRKYMNLIIVFFISGLWHGSGLGFIIWGLLHGIYQVVGAVTKNIRNVLIFTCHIDKTSFSYRLFETIITFLLVNFAWIFFRVPRFAVAIEYIQGITQDFGLWSLLDGSLFTYGLTQNMLFVLLLAILVVFAIDVYNYKGKSFCVFLEKQNIVFRWCVYFALIYAILIFGVYNVQNVSGFIYGGF